MDRLILQKAASYCAYQERTQDEVRQRLKKWNVWGEEADELIAELISLNYLSEERFAKTYAGGKHRIKHWGKMKIRQELHRRGLSEYSIEKGMAEIESGTYLLGLQELLVKKRDSLTDKETDPFRLKQKLARFALGKGYEAELVWKVIDEMTGRAK
ncbi:Regulatory protein RecX [Dyadobacter sp. CECT 9275]|uniref:Regulatory protein RecX n=1 Tax=Dyadobacter helix TaxID=2822344 RepID=A0A916JF86_9BACT|nr:regulatory protein RecX [Dyadobacter sp. CECT 9275]CAG5007487.1 Regulatory protein RecX [Dyadobacter sp. CECT 9275]